MTAYMELLANQSPFTIGVDDNSRVMFSCNYRVRADSPIAKFEEEIVRLLTNADLGTPLATTAAGYVGDTVTGPATPLPTAGDGPFVRVLSYGGMEPLETHDAQKDERPFVQILTYAKSYVAARNRAMSIFRELDGKRGFTVSV